MNRKTLRETYDLATAQVSAIVRQLGFAAIAGVWVFRPASDPLPVELFTVGALAVAALTLDFAQYLYSSVAWGAFNRWKEWRGVAEDAQFQAPDWINWPTLILFWTKAAAIVMCYWYFLAYVAGHI